jgi:hypothetical protein
MRGRWLGAVAAVILALVAALVARSWLADRSAAAAAHEAASNGSPPSAASTDSARDTSGEAKSGAGEKPLAADVRTVSEEQRLDAIARAAVWQRPATPIADAWLGADPDAPKEITCRFKMTELGGTTPKFDCTLESGETIRIKYGNGPEIPAEAAATRLLHALGFGSDTITILERLHCRGCPAEPFSTMRAVEVTKAQPLYKHVIDYGDTRDFEWVALERKLEARPIESPTVEGWAFFELDRVDPAKGGAPRAHVDALRLMAAFLAHWDNKPENQRIVCLAEAWAEGTACPRPFLLIQDAGATFGPSKVDLESWEGAAIWDDRTQCTVSLRHLPYDGATFGHARISDAGRRHLGGLLAQLSERQLADLFSGARFDKKHGIFSGARPIADWVRVFRKKAAQITDGPACPAV